MLGKGAEGLCRVGGGSMRERGAGYPGTVVRAVGRRRLLFPLRALPPYLRCGPAAPAAPPGAREAAQGKGARLPGVKMAAGRGRQSRARWRGGIGPPCEEALVCYHRVFAQGMRPGAGSMHA